MYIAPNRIRWSFVNLSLRNKPSQSNNPAHNGSNTQHTKYVDFFFSPFSQSPLYPQVNHKLSGSAEKTVVNNKLQPSGKLIKRGKKKWFDEMRKERAWKGLGLTAPLPTWSRALSGLNFRFGE